MSAVVVRLPTAAARKVQQPWNRARRAAREQLPQFPRDHHLFPEQRKAMQRARIIRQIETCPALAIATALFRQLDEMAQLHVIGGIGLQAAAARNQRQVLLQAVEWLNAHRKGFTLGDSTMLEWAFDQLEKEEGE